VTGQPTGADVVRRALSSPATLADGRLMCVDGPAGSGKTSFAESVRRAVPAGMTCRVLHMDDVYPGWAGLADGVAVVAEGVVERLARGVPGGYRRYDWVQGRLAERVDVDPVDLLVVEGVGSGALSYAPLVTTLVWVEAEAAVRLARGLVRDGEAAREHWVDWMAQEQTWFAEQRTRERADVVVRTDGRQPTSGSCTSA
jgi:uridine kinase